MVRLVPTGNGSEVVEVYDTKQCTGCGARMAYPHVQFGYHPCSCDGGQGHQTVRCLDCNTTHYEPPHDPALDPGPGHGGMDQCRPLA